jgi:hypothetical protein
MIWFTKVKYGMASYWKDRSFVWEIVVGFEVLVGQVICIAVGRIILRTKVQFRNKLLQCFFPCSFVKLMFRRSDKAMG